MLYKRLAVRRFLLRTGQVVEVGLDAFPEAQAASFNILSDIDVGGDGSIYVPIVWSEAGRIFHSGVAVWNPQGRYERTIRLDPPVEVRHIALGDNGDLFVLGMDPDHYKGLRPENFLVHKYTPSGRRLASFSQTSLRAPIAAKGGVHRDLTTEADRGKLWMQDGTLWQMQPVTRGLRAFSLDGRLLREVRFAPPTETGSGTAWIWNVFKVSGDQFLVDWVLEENSPGALRRSRGVVAHDAIGRPISRLTGPLDGIDMPIACDSAGTCVVIRGGPGAPRVMASARLAVE
ncbi:MAG: hypothetical protein IT159_16220 [Bryobacterales bacterium]|nr:hypothetical protein [Bryobacterales bacterium]